MLRFAADQNFSGRIIAGVRQKKPEVEFARLQDVGLAAASDPEVLEWCAEENRILLSHDVSTITAFAFDRVRAGRKMPGVFLIRQRTSIGEAIESLLLVAACSIEGEWENCVLFLPL